MGLVINVASTKSKMMSKLMNNYKLLKILLSNWTSTFELHFKPNYSADKQNYNITKAKRAL